MNVKVGGELGAPSQKIRERCIMAVENPEP